MGIADIPTNLGPSFLIRTFIPGFIASLLSYITFDIMSDCVEKASPETSKHITSIPTMIQSPFTETIVSLAILGILLGMMLSELDVQIYQFFEGLRFWPESIWNWRFKKVLDDFDEIDRGLHEIKMRKKEIHQMGESSCDDETIRELSERESELSAKAREFPYNPASGSYCKRYPEAATRFGNIIAEYEQYSEIQYGMHMMVFWQHLSLILPAEIKEELDLRGAKADFLVYLSFISLCYAFVGGAAFAGSAALLHCCGLDDERYFFIYSIICFIVSLLLSYVFYSASIYSIKNYGRYVKAVFDLYRFDLASKMQMTITEKQLIAGDEEAQSWRKLRKYLLDYKK